MRTSSRGCVSFFGASEASARVAAGSSGADSGGGDGRHLGNAGGSWSRTLRRRGSAGLSAFFSGFAGGAALASGARGAGVATAGTIGFAGGGERREAPFRRTERDLERAAQPCSRSERRALLAPAPAPPLAPPVALAQLRSPRSGTDLRGCCATSPRERCGDAEPPRTARDTARLAAGEHREEAREAVGEYRDACQGAGGDGEQDFEGRIGLGRQRSSTSMDNSRSCGSRAGRSHGGRGGARPGVNVRCAALAGGGSGDNESSAE
mmetsp:Transcript_93021/g.161685  ORF Transcript_93021/g.161685 Transcript_93021/m.161685 type:complete len:265 (-) Transcript_93021:1303-2097(-)